MNITYDDIMDDTDYRTYRPYKDMKCLASALTITNVTKADLGEYQCKLETLTGDQEETEIDNIRRITVVNSALEGTLPKKITYFENVCTQSSSRGTKLLMQCVVTGGPVHWFIRFDSDQCRRWEEQYDHNKSKQNSCVNDTIRPIEQISKMDNWHCFNYNIEHHNPYSGLEQVTESFIYIDNLCALDWAGIYCSADPEGTVRSEQGELVIKGQRLKYIDFWVEKDLLEVLSYAVPLTITIIFFLVGTIVAGARVKSIDFSRGGGRLGNYTIMQAAPQSLHVPDPHAPHSPGLSQLHSPPAYTE